MRTLRIISAEIEVKQQQGDSPSALQKGCIVSRWHFRFLVVVTFVGSLIGGAVSGWWLVPSPVKAREDQWGEC